MDCLSFGTKRSKVQILSPRFLPKAKIEQWNSGPVEQTKNPEHGQFHCGLLRPWLGRPASPNRRRRAIHQPPALPVVGEYRRFRPCGSGVRYSTGSVILGLWQLSASAGDPSIDPFRHHRITRNVRQARRPTAMSSPPDRA